MIIHGIIASEAGPGIPPVPPVDPNYPAPHSGDYQTSAALQGVSWSNRGTPADPGGAIASVSSSGSGLFRSKYTGNFTPSPGSLPVNWNMNFFSTAGTPMGTIADNYVSFGGQVDVDPNTNFSMEWKGYIKAPADGNHNVYITCDDDTVIWIGSNALTPTNSNYTAWGSNKTIPNIVNANSMTLTQNMYYPVRIWFSEFSGACRMQVFFINSFGATYAGDEIVWAYNTTTGGYNP